jgi:hypothetical protein
MGCLVVALAMMMPRVTMIFIYLLTGWFGTVFKSWGWPVAGFIFMPYTTLAYMAATLNSEGSIGMGWLVLIIFAVLVDMGHWGGSWKFRWMRRKD